MQHTLEEIHQGDMNYRCSTCTIEFDIHPNTLTTNENRFLRELAECPGVQIYEYEKIPVTMAIKTWFSKQSLESDGVPVGCYVNLNECHPAYILLYAKKSARPRAKKRPSEDTWKRAFKAVGITIEE